MEAVLTRVKDEKSEWREVKNRLPQGSACTDNIFNDMTEGVSSYISLFVDNVNLLTKIKNHKDCEELLNDINKMYG